VTRPVRLQLSCRKGFDLQAWSREVNGLPAVKVDRASGFGNRFRISKGTETTADGKRPVWLVEDDTRAWIAKSAEEAHDISVKAFGAWAAVHPEFRARVRSELRDKNLGCWCGAKLACHVDVLIEIANPPESSPMIDQGIR
jgi:hypothetical protein